MALYIVNDITEVEPDLENLFRVKCFDDIYKLQCEFCRFLEKSVDYPEDNIMANPRVQEYLKGFDLEYIGNFMIRGRWYENGSVEERFITFLNYSVQLGCVALHLFDSKIYFTDFRLFEAKHLIPVLKQKDIYVNSNAFYLNDPSDLIDIVDEGIELIIDGKTSLEMERNDVIDYLLMRDNENGYLTRELDAKVFDSSKIRIFEPEEMDLRSYINRFDDGSIGGFEWALEECPELAEVKVMVNGFNEFSSGAYRSYRRYPMHMLFNIDGKWKYVCNNSVKWPNFIELLKECILQPEPYNYDKQCDIDVSSARKIFTLVLDCDEVCNATSYWKYVCFIAKYDRETKILEICDKNKGLLEFHELFQLSEDF